MFQTRRVPSAGRDRRGAFGRVGVRGSRVVEGQSWAAASRRPGEPPGGPRRSDRCGPMTRHPPDALSPNYSRLFHAPAGARVAARTGGTTRGGVAPGYARSQARKGLDRRGAARSKMHPRSPGCIGCIDSSRNIVAAAESGRCHRRSTTGSPAASGSPRLNKRPEALQRQRLREPSNAPRCCI